MHIHSCLKARHPLERNRVEKSQDSSAEKRDRENSTAFFSGIPKCIPADDKDRRKNDDSHGFQKRMHWQWVRHTEEGKLCMSDPHCRREGK